MRGRTTKVGTIKTRGEPGANTLDFSGWVKGRRLAPGLYSAVVEARDRYGRTSNRRRINFRVI